MSESWVVTKAYIGAGAAGALVLLLTACGGRPSAVPTQGPSASGGAPAAMAPAPAAGPATPAVATAGPTVTEAVALINGRPAWAPNRQHSAAENIRYQFGKNGADFGAANESDYVARAHAFIENPPAGAETLSRPNGDRLIYDARSNVFAVVTKDGAPRTMFKPRDGAAYWTQQKQRVASAARRGDDNES